MVTRVDERVLEAVAVSGTPVAASLDSVGVAEQSGKTSDEPVAIVLPAAASAVGHPVPVRRPQLPFIGRRLGDRSGKPLYAALDLGTNNCRLLIAEPTFDSFQVVDAFSRIVRLGEGLSLTGSLGEPAMRRAIEALHVCRDKIRYRGVRRARCIATEACRSAANGREFLDRVQREVGLDLEVVDRETEARLAVSGCASLVDPNARGVLLFDIGGGSSELVWLDLDRRRDSGIAASRCVAAWTSLPFGVVTLAERFGGIHVDRAVFEHMVELVANHLASFDGSGRITAGLARGGVHMLGTSGTVTTLAGLHLGLRRYDRRRVDGLWLDDGCIGGLLDRLLGMSYEERIASPCIGAERADLVLAGCAILEAIRRAWPCDRLRVADRGLREGMLATLIAEDRRDRHRRRGRGRKNHHTWAAREGR
jgi:exopolyphosphatase/guanosine-5'-triphosphate,3'-diphosphate pyrophosphatase